MTSFTPPAAALSAPPGRCRAQAPDQWTVECQLTQGHTGPHRNNQTIWNDQTTDGLHIETERWQEGRVLLFDDVEPDFGPYGDLNHVP